jgi:capsule polysaccharide export protein KpsC/LpsZ
MWSKDYLSSITAAVEGCGGYLVWDTKGYYYKTDKPSRVAADSK